MPQSNQRSDLPRLDAAIQVSVIQSKSAQIVGKDARPWFIM